MGERTDKVVADASEADLVLELRMPEHFSADGVSSRICDHCLVLLDLDDAGGETSLELGLQLFRDRRQDFDARKQAV